MTQEKMHTKDILAAALDDDEMNDEELINNMAENLEKVLSANFEGNGLHAVQNMAIKDKFYRLIALARRGAAVQPRPISEAPKDGDFLGVAEGSFRTMQRIDGEWCHYDYKSENPPTHFYDLSDLPLPISKPSPLPPGAEIATHVAPITEALKVKDYYVDDYYGKVFGGPRNEIDWGPDVGREIVGAATGAGEEGEMVERVAKAIYIADVSPERPKKWEDLDESWKDKNERVVYLTFARAAIAAINGGK